MTTAQDVFEAAIALMDSQNENGEADTADNAEYKNRTLPILNLLRGELYPYSDTYETDENERPIATLIRRFDKPLDLDDYICQSVMPYGLAAHLLLAEDPATANFFQQRYDELKALLSRGFPAQSVDITDVYGSRGGIDPYNEFSLWS
jgi:hypothetical protein